MPKIRKVHCPLKKQALLYVNIMIWIFLLGIVHLIAWTSMCMLSPGQDEHLVPLAIKHILKIPT
jgi:hypothetical protein